ncbi:MAG TPA: protein kinase [Trebonia sp.]|nr:protein kinase [Trebonia sp.]
MEPETVLDGRYRVQAVLGSGGMGKVWRGFDTLLQREVAVKVLRDDVNAREPKVAERFWAEAAIAARLRHPGITVVYDAGQHNGRGRLPGQLFIVTELLLGGDLDKSLEARPGPRPVRQVADYGSQLAEALAYAHDNGIVHRDLKPSNVFVEAGDRLKICDFGIAAIIDATTRLTQTGTVVGTPAYMSPEQWEGTRPAASMDLYALGCLLYLLLAGRLPFSGENPSVLMRQHFNSAPVPPRDLNSQVPAGLSDLVLALLAKEPRQRPPSARAVRDVLTRLRDVAARPASRGRDTPTEPPGPPAPAPGCPPRSPGPRPGTLPTVPPPPGAPPPPVPAPSFAFSEAGAVRSPARTGLVACASPGEEELDIVAVDRVGRVQGRADSRYAGYVQGDGRWRPWFGADELPGKVTALAEGMSHGSHWAIAAVAGGVPYLKLDNRESEPLCEPGAASPVRLPVRDVAVLYGPGVPEVFALDSGRAVWRMPRPGGSWERWGGSPAPAREAPAAIAMATSAAGHQAFALAEGTRVMMKARAPYGDWSGWGSHDVGRRLTDAACSASERHLAVFALDERGRIWQGLYAPAGGAPSPRSELAPWDAVTPPPGSVTGIAATALDPRRAADDGGVLIAMTADGVVHSARYELAGPGRSRWSPWGPMPALG